VVYQKAADKVIEEAHKETYDFILLLGLAGDRKEITIEHHALNLMDAKGPDNEGQIKRFEVIDQKGPNLYLTDILVFHYPPGVIFVMTRFTGLNTL